MENIKITCRSWNCSNVFYSPYALKVGKILHGKLGSLDTRSFLCISVLLNTIVGDILGATHQIMIYLELV